jgi:hypothetical protein
MVSEVSHTLMSLFLRSVWFSPWREKESVKGGEKLGRSILPRLKSDETRDVTHVGFLLRRPPPPPAASSPFQVRCRLCEIGNHAQRPVLQPGQAIYHPPA